jgi:hypothetical protein
MKKALLLICPFLLATNILIGQSKKDVTLGKKDTTLGRMKLNFVVPDLPAFKILGTEPTDLLRPSTPKAIAASLSSFNSNNKFVIPKAFAIEVSPALLLNSNKGPTELKEYAKNAVVNSFRISVGSVADTLLSKSGRSIALGLRISLINEGDFGTDVESQQLLAAALHKFRLNSDTALKQFAIEKGLKEEYNASLNKEDGLEFFEIKYQKQFNEYLANEDEVNQKEFSSSVKKFKDDYKEKHWNDEKLDLAFAVMTSSPDSLAKNLKFNQAQFWLTWAHKTGKTNKSQLLAGINAQVVKNLLDTVPITKDKSYFNLSVPVRLLFGTNRVKGFAEGQYKYDGVLKESNAFLSIGAELNIVDGVWVNFHGGFRIGSKSKSTAIVNLNLKLTLPENFSFF